jgi:hypothetical protein
LGGGRLGAGNYCCHDDDRHDLLLKFDVNEVRFQAARGGGVEISRMIPGIGSAGTCFNASRGCIGGANISGPAAGSAAHISMHCVTSVAGGPGWSGWSAQCPSVIADEAVWAAAGAVVITNGISISATTVIRRTRAIAILVK